MSHSHYCSASARRASALQVQARVGSDPAAVENWGCRRLAVEERLPVGSLMAEEDTWLAHSLEVVDTRKAEDLADCKALKEARKMLRRRRRRRHSMTRGDLALFWPRQS